MSVEEKIFKFYNYVLMSRRTRCLFRKSMSPTADFESRTIYLMTSLQYYCILGLAEIKNCNPETKLCAKDAGYAGNKITYYLQEESMHYHMSR